MLVQRGIGLFARPGIARQQSGDYRISAAQRRDLAWIGHARVEFNPTRSRWPS